MKINEDIGEAVEEAVEGSRSVIHFLDEVLNFKYFMKHLIATNDGRQVKGLPRE